MVLDRQQSLLTALAPTGSGHLAAFHPAVASWFDARFPDGPTEPQRRAWPAIATGRDVLVASPTGSGKTLTGFLVAIDTAWRAHDAGEPSLGGPRVVYVSPLRALAADVTENLDAPLEGITAAARELGLDGPTLRVGLRTGDSTPAERTALRKHPPDLLVTTPESLYLLLTSASGRAMFAHTETVVIDEIHAVCRDKRGSHLALSLERLDRLVADRGRRLQRIGLSATQRPIETVASMLSGAAPGREGPIVVDCSAPPDFDVAIELPSGELETARSRRPRWASCSTGSPSTCSTHRTTLVFVNNRRMAERVAHQLAERLSPTSSASTTRTSSSPPITGACRRRAVATSRRGCAPATCARSSRPRRSSSGSTSVRSSSSASSARRAPSATFLQRIGRANHQVGGVPKGGSSRSTATSSSSAPRCSQASAPGTSTDCTRRSPRWTSSSSSSSRRSPPAARSRSTSSTRCDRGRPLRGALARAVRRGHRPRGERHRHGPRPPRCAPAPRRVNGVVRPRRSAGLAALLGAGAIPELGEYRVMLDPDNVTVGSVHEDFAVEAAAGDIFLLGTHSWRVLKVETGTVRVADAQGLPPTTPFWLGEAPARTEELSAAGLPAAGARRGTLDRARRRRRARGGARVRGRRRRRRRDRRRLPGGGARALGVLPTTDRLVIERFFDDNEAAQLVVHAPLGGRINRALGLALRKRFCVIVRLRAAGGGERRRRRPSPSARTTASRSPTS